jgi:hypothetical protein
MRAVAGLALVLSLGCRAPRAVADPVPVPAGVSHAEWSRLLHDYVDDDGLVDYGRWKANPADAGALARYLAAFGAAGTPAQGPERVASAINAYNALTVAWVLRHYPTTSIRAMKDSFTARRHRVGGRDVSLDDLEHKTLRPLAGYRVHAALVCAARSCPPLRREAFLPATLEAQLDDAMARWLARADLNRFDAEAGRARVSRIFDWFSEDFAKAGGLREVLRRHGPPDARAVAARGEPEVAFLDYDWSLNDQRPPAP